MGWQEWIPALFGTVVLFYGGTAFIQRAVAGLVAGDVVLIRPSSWSGTEKRAHLVPRTMTMTHVDLRRIFAATVSTGALTLAACASPTLQGGPAGGMMGGGYGNGWMGGYRGPGMLILLVVIAGLMVWIFTRRRNKP